MFITNKNNSRFISVCFLLLFSVLFLSPCVDSAFAKALSLSYPSFVREDAGRILNAVTVVLSQAETYTLNVSLSSSNDQYLAVQSSVAIAQGKTEVNFFINLKDNATVNSMQSVQIIASASGWEPATAVIAICDDDDREFQWLNPLPTGNPINSVLEIDNTVFVVSKGLLLQRENSVWSELFSGSGYDLKGIWGITKNSLYTIGSFFDSQQNKNLGKIIKHTGTQWSEMTLPTNEFEPSDIWGTSETNIYVVGKAGLLPFCLHFDGTQWKELSIPATVPLKGIWGVSETDIMIIAGLSGYTSGYFRNEGYAIHFNGSQWIQSNSFNRDVNSVWGYNGVYYVVGSGDPVYKYDSGTGTWLMLYSNKNLVYNSVWGFTKDNVYFGGSIGEFGSIIHFDGTYWEDVNIPSETAPIKALYGISQDHLLAAGKNGILIESNGNAEWKKIMPSSVGNFDVKSIWGRKSDSGAAAVSDSGDAILFDGSSWYEPVPAFTPTLRFLDIWGIDETFYLVCGSGKMFTFDRTNGINEIPSKLSNDIVSIFGTSSKEIVAITSMAEILTYTGTEWLVSKPFPYMTARDIWMTGMNDIFLVSTNTVEHFDGTTWAVSLGNLTDTTLEKIWGTSSNDVFVIGSKYAATSSSPTTLIWHFDGSEWKDTLIVGSQAMNRIWGRASDNVHIFGYGGQIYNYNGQIWNKIENITENTLYDAWGDPTNSSIFFVGEKGTILRYKPKVSFRIEAIANQGGIVTPSGLISVVSGSNKVFSIVPDSGYEIKDVLINNISQGPISSYEFNNIAASHKIEVIFNKITSTSTSKPPSQPSINHIYQTDDNVSFILGSFHDPNGDSHKSTFWEFRRLDHPYSCETASDYCYTATSGAGMYSYSFTGLKTGMSYALHVGYEDSSGETSWSDEYVVCFGNETYQNMFHLGEGTKVEDYKMVSFVQWPGDGQTYWAVLGANDPASFRFGTYDPMTGGYFEYGKNLAFTFGKAYWILSRKRLDISFVGIPVSTDIAVDIELKYNATTKDGWNMIGSPNLLDYYWDKVHVVIYDSNGQVTETKSVSEYKYYGTSNQAIDVHLWSYENGYYRYDNAIIKKYEGYWVKANQSNVYLRFDPTAKVTKARSDIKTELITTVPTEYPPMPMGDFDKQAEDSSGCFVDTVTHDVFQ